MSVAIEVGVPLAQQHLGTVVGADLLAAVPAAAAGAKLGVQILLGIATTQLLPIGKRLAVVHQRQIDVDVTDHLGHGAAGAIRGLDVERLRAEGTPPLVKAFAKALARDPATRAWLNDHGHTLISVVNENAGATGAAVIEILSRMREGLRAVITGVP